MKKKLTTELVEHRRVIVIHEKPSQALGKLENFVGETLCCRNKISSQEVKMFPNKFRNISEAEAFVNSVLDSPTIQTMVHIPVC